MQLNSGFDYQTLNDENRRAIQERTKKLKELWQRTAQDIWEIGQILADVQLRLKQDRQFDGWLKAEFGLSRRTAYNFINVYKAFQEDAKFAQINLDPSALYLLASPSTPQEIRDEIIQQASTGAKVTHKEIKQAICNNKSKPSHGNTSSATAERPPALGVKKLVADAKTSVTDVEVKYTVTEVQHEQPTSRPTSPIVNYALNSEAIWWLLESKHLLFCGDTNSQQFIKRLPVAAMALGVSAGEWQYDWLTKKAKATIILDQQKIFDEELIEQLVKMCSKPQEAVIVPWFPSGRIIARIHNLGRVLYTGDGSYERCQQAIARSALKALRVNLPELS
jgi:hypothetical protein